MLRSKIFLMLIFGAIIFCNAITHAEIKTYEGYGEYFMADGETVATAKEKAALEAQRDTLEQIIVYVKSSSSTHNSKLTEDEIITIAAGILRVTNTKHVIDATDLGLKVKAFVTATVDIDELKILLDKEVQRRMEE